MNKDAKDQLDTGWDDNECPACGGMGVFENPVAMAAVEAGQSAKGMLPYVKCYACTAYACQFEYLNWDF